MDFATTGNIIEPRRRSLDSIAIQKSQGTRLSETAPWDSYDDELGCRMSPELAAQVAAYSEKRYADSKTDNQTKETLAELEENNRDNSKQYQWLTPEEYSDYEARIGIVISHEQFITLLRKHGIVCHYRQHAHPDKAVLWVSRDTFSEPEVAAWVQIGQMPELSLMNFDKYGVPLAEKRRGWRTVLLQMILKGLITEEKANKIFGRPRQDSAFDRYNLTLKSFRDAGSRLGE